MKSGSAVSFTQQRIAYESNWLRQIRNITEV